MSSPNNIVVLVVFEKLKFELFFAVVGVGGKLISGDGDSLNASWKLIGAVGGDVNARACGAWNEVCGNGGGGRLLLLLLLLLQLKNVGLFSNALNVLCVSMSTVLRVFFIKMRAISFFQALLITVQRLNFNHQSWNVLKYNFQEVLSLKNIFFYWI